MQEADKVQWTDVATGLPCLIVRSGMGNLCGYAGVERGHALHGCHYDDPKAEILDAHGGLTFAGGCAELPDPGFGVCHIPEPGTADTVWWFGFDCGHYMDLSPGLAASIAPRGTAGAGIWEGHVYRDMDYVRRECEGLAVQLAMAAQ